MSTNPPVLTEIFQSGPKPSRLWRPPSAAARVAGGRKQKHGTREIIWTLKWWVEHLQPLRRAAGGRGEVAHGVELRLSPGLAACSPASKRKQEGERPGGGTEDANVSETTRSLNEHTKTCGAPEGRPRAPQVLWQNTVGTEKHTETKPKKNKCYS